MTQFTEKQIDQIQREWIIQAIIARREELAAQEQAYQIAIAEFNALQSPYTRPVLVRTLEQVRASWEARELPREMPKMGLIARAWLLLVR